MSQDYLNHTELTRLHTSLKDGEVLIVKKDGRILKTSDKKIREDKLESVGRIPGKLANSFDGNGSREYFITKSVVNQDTPPFKNYWEYGGIRLPEKSDNPIVGWLILLLELTPQENLRMGKKIINERDIEYISLELKGTGIEFYFTKTVRKIRFVMMPDEKTGKLKKIWL